MITDYTSLVSDVATNSNRTDLTAIIPTFVQMAEAEFQRVLKLVDFEGTATVTITNGSGPLPTDYAGFRAAYFDGDQKRPLQYITPDRYNALEDIVDVPTFYTVEGSTLKTMSGGDGSVVLTYNARFTPLSGTNLTNAIVTTYPDAYFFGSLKYLYHHTRNWVAKAEQDKELQRVLQQIIKDHKERKYPGPLQVKAR